jgi:hypothetical protein
MEREGERGGEGEVPDEFLMSYGVCRDRDDRDRDYRY